LVNQHGKFACLELDVTGISSLNVSTVESVSATINPAFGVYTGEVSSDSLSDDSDHDEIR